jgi:hypothetical protein
LTYYWARAEISRMFGKGLAIFQWVVLSLAAASTALFVHRIVNKGEAISATAHWGGLGGGTSGWRITPALASLCAAIALWGLGSAISVYAFNVQHTDDLAAAKLQNDQLDAATKLKNAREDAATKLKNDRETARLELDEKHREQERADKAANSATAPSSSAVPKNGRFQPAAPAPLP